MQNFCFTHPTSPGAPSFSGRYKSHNWDSVITAYSNKISLLKCHSNIWIPRLSMNHEDGSRCDAFFSDIGWKFFFRSTQTNSARTCPNMPRIFNSSHTQNIPTGILAQSLDNAIEKCNLTVLKSGFFYETWWYGRYVKFIYTDRKTINKLEWCQLLDNKVFHIQAIIRENNTNKLTQKSPNHNHGNYVSPWRGYSSILTHTFWRIWCICWNNVLFFMTKHITYIGYTQTKWSTKNQTAILNKKVLFQTIKTVVIN